jgi:hypothetical protein
MFPADCAYFPPDGEGFGFDSLGPAGAVTPLSGLLLSLAPGLSLTLGSLLSLGLGSLSLLISNSF